nr:alpha/beta hydrolase [Gammaproteobacteria bacterium]
RWDMRGHGRSDCPTDRGLYSQTRTVEDMRELLDALGIDKAVIGGHSLGGFMSLAFHAAYPDRVSALILQGCGPGYRKDAARETWNQRAQRRAETIEQGGLAALGGGTEVGASVQSSAQGLANAARGILSQVDATVIDSLPSISVPTLVVIGAEDKPFLDGSNYMAARIPGAQHVVVNGAGHGVNIEKPAEVNQAFAALFERVSDA